MQEHIITISAQIPSHLDKGLIKICEMEERSKSYFIKKAIEMLLKEKLEDLEEYNEDKKAYDEYKKSKKKTIPYDKIRKKYKL
jgi:predicted DNA-binding protein